MPHMTTTVPTTVFSGFLGSGKTTIIAHLIDQLQQAEKQVVYIKNEIGSENIDGQIMEGKHIRTKQLLNGCICCTLVGPFIAAATEIIESLHPHRIIIEASGAADPAAIALMIDSHPLLERDGVLAIIDVLNFEGYADLSMTARNQATFTDLIVFNKVEGVSVERKRAVVDLVRELNTHAPIVEAPGGVLPASVAFGANSAELTSLLAEAGFDQNQDHHPHDHHLAQDGLDSFSIHLSEPIDTQKLQSWLDHIPANIYRVKGFAQTNQGDWVLVNKVGKRSQLQLTTDAPQVVENSTGTIVCIGFHVLEHRETLEQQLRA